LRTLSLHLRHSRGLKASIRNIVVGQCLVNYADLAMSASLIKSNKMMVPGRGDSRRRQFDLGGPNQGTSKRGSALDLLVVRVMKFFEWW
ncbi:hypothetical protein GBA52_015083, partial [Prunus armeniaca]